MDYEIMPQTERDLGRGAALLVSGAVMVLLMLVVPYIAWIAVAAYGLYRLYLREIGEGLVALAIAVLVFFLSGVLAFLIWILGALMAGTGLFFLIRGLLGKSRA